MKMQKLIKRILVKGIQSFKFRTKVFKTIFTPFLIKRFLKRKKIFLELGLNEKKGGDWVTLSIEANSDLTYDLLKGIPFPDNSIDLIYTSHTLEHFSFNKINYILSECYRTLKKGGELSIAVPNAREYIESYLKDESLGGESQEMYFTSSPIDQVNFIAYMGGHHHYMFDETNLIKLIKKNLFTSAKLRDFDVSLDIPNRIQIFAKAIK